MTDLTVEFILTSQDADLVMYVKECELSPDPFPLLDYHNQTIADTSPYKTCIPSDTMKSTLNGVKKANAANQWGVQRLQVSPNCFGEAVFVK